MKQIYLDHNATTKMEQSAANTLLFSIYGNPSSIHWAGRKAKAVVEDAREQIASAFGIEDPEDICFTASATEATNTALKGLFFQAQKEGQRLHLITSTVEHEATLETAKFLAELGASVQFLPVNPQGELDLMAYESALKTFSKERVLVSLMAANNETGVVFPWEKCALMAREHGAFFHLDAVQAPGKLPNFSLQNAPVDMASFSAHKIGGMKGVGALSIRRGLKLVSLLHGGAQERKRRAGTMNVPGILSFGEATKALSQRDLNAVARLRDAMEERVKKAISGVEVHGQDVNRIVNTSNMLFEGVRGEGLVMALDLAGFAVSSGSACNSGSILPSHVLLAMGRDKSAAQSALRVSLGPENTIEEVQSFVEALTEIIKKLRK